ncbi:ABC transporter ATP-binding protein [Pleomorphomonas diazotrophica]|uniref:Nickel import system ATP-binding protein NikD n=1 Tax=Pleomorphomonas diazotrophica TaxID=1166257 RepID=A0A1I4WB67_9HYPH|nr:ABC transporter ATP-binding protein [Pleomorphomonas diazotrophica]PKR89024.1 ABC transporter ATP-binding protein [Pleomorphomonas diazotrophica]SFN11024.1 peptide/nickel transport system ATP-binding protein [Pleomorphomonas diazotrophica]
MTTLAAIDGLTVTYRRAPAPALSGLSLDIEAGEILAIIGESGSGKSTLARAIAGLLPEKTTIAGRLTWPGLDGAPRAGRDIGYVFQDPGSSLNPVLTIGEQVGEGARRHLGLDRRAAVAEAVRLLARVHLPEPQRIARAYPHQLSGGQRQRVAIAAAIAARPRLLIADEVTSALDVLVQAAIVDLLVELVRADGMTLVFVTHDLALASGIADRVAVMAEGRLVELGPTAEVVGAPRAVETAALVAAHIDLSSPPLVGEAS